MTSIAHRRTRASAAWRRRLAGGLASSTVRYIVLGLTLALAGAIRVALAQSSQTRLDSDQAVTGLMAEKILDGQTFLFYAGQHYMGAGEQYLQALALAVFPGSELALKLPSVVLSVATCYLVYRVGALVLGSELRALVAAVLYAIGPYFNLVFGSKASGAYVSAQLLATAGLLVALVFTREHQRSRLFALGFGMILGLGYWQNWTSALLLVPAAMWFLGSARGHVVRFAVPVASGFVVGALPAIVHALKYHVVPHPPQGPPSTLFVRAEALTDVVVPAFAGLKLSNGGPVLDALPSSVVVLAFVAAFGAAVWSRRRGMLALVRGRTDDRQPIDALLLAFALIPLFWLPSRLGAIVPEPRYLVALAPAFSIALVALVPRRPRAEVAGCLALVLMTAALTAAAIDRVADAGGNAPVVNGGAPVRTEPLRALVPELERHGIHAVYADYWIAYVLQFYADDSLAVEADSSSRFADLSQRVRNDPSPAYVALAGLPADALKRRLGQEGAAYRTLTVEGAAAFYDIRPSGQPGDPTRGFLQALARSIDPGAVRTLTSSYLFRVQGVGAWFVEARGGRLSITAGERRADCVILASEETFGRLFTGQLDPASAYMTGAVQVRGDRNAALDLLTLVQEAVGRERR